jgi:multicomponent Na+:H+ antiporter subunit D
MLQLYQHDFWRPVDSGAPSPWARQLPTAILALLALAAGVWPEPLLAVSRSAMAAVGP